MAVLTQFACNALLNWAHGGAAVAPPAHHAIGLCPNAPAATELSGDAGYAPQTVIYGAATNGTVTNINSLTFGPFSTSHTISGLIMKDTLGSGGNVWEFCTLLTARTTSTGDSFVLAPGTLNYVELGG